MSEIRSPILAPLLDAWLAKSSGLYVLRTEAGESKVYLKAGRIVQVEGVEGLLAGVVEGALLQGELLADVGAVAVLGAPIDAAMSAAAENLGRFIVRAMEMPDTSAGFTAGVAAPPGSFPLPQEPPQVVVKGVRAQRSDEAVRVHLAPVADHRPRALAGPLSGSLDPAALRVYTRCKGDRSVEDIVSLDAASGAARAAATRRSLDMLMSMGLVELLEPTAAAPPPQAPAQPEAAAPPPARPAEPAERRRSNRRSRSRTVEVEQPPVDPAEELGALAERLQHLTPLEALGIPDDEPADNITRERVDKAFRAMAQTYHPDRFAGEPEAVRDAAARVFAVLNDHCSALTDPRALDEARARLAARQKGEVYVRDMDREKAKVLLRKAELVERTRAWAHGRQLLAQAAALDPVNPMVKVLDAFYAVVLKELAPDVAITELRALKLSTDRERAEAAYRIGRIHRLAQRDDVALVVFRKAIEHNPGHVGAQRELRLLQRRVGDAPTRS